MDNIFAKKSLGQHWLNDQPSLEAICDAAELKPEDTVLEIGPGLGALTRLLVSKVKAVIAVELDDNLASELKNRVTADNLVVFNQDILTFDFSSLPEDYSVVANIPYYLTSNLIRVLSETNNPPERAVLLVQKEVAERAAAEPGKMSILSVTAQFYWQVELGNLVPAKLFTPPPKVDSQTLILKRRQKPLYEDIDTKDFFRVVKAGFSQRRKTLLNSLSSGLQLSRDHVKAICETVSIDPGKRAQTLSIEQWYQLYNEIYA